MVKRYRRDDYILSDPPNLAASQKVFESLALHRSITFGELVRQINEGIKEDYYQYKVEEDDDILIDICFMQPTKITNRFS